MSRYRLTRYSGNEKTGPIPVSTVSRRTCPLSCPHYDTSCYGLYGRVRFWWDKLTDEGGLTFEEFMEKLSKIPYASVYRHAQAGDLPGEGDNLDEEKLSLLARAARYVRGIAFTHKPLAPRKNVGEEVWQRNLGIYQRWWARRKRGKLGLTVNVSCDTFAEVDHAMDQGFPTVCSVPTGSPKIMRTPQGRRGVQCPAVWSEHIQCANCGGHAKGSLCWRVDRDYFVTFPAHGAGKRYINEAW